jgi:serine/threonine protein kinase
MPKHIQQQYEVLYQLGSGSFAQTYLVKDVRHPKQANAILKLLKPVQLDCTFRTLAQVLFEREVQVLKALGHHASIPTLLAEFDGDGETGLVQSFVEGKPVQAVFRQGLLWSEAQLVSFLEAALNTLVLVHEAGFIHRDLTPAHWIQPSEGGVLVLIDFNSALRRWVREETHGTLEYPTLETAFAIGTAGYMAPEQMQGHADFGSDLYALGLIAIQGLTGRSPAQLDRNAQSEFCWQPLKPIRVELIDVLTHLVRCRPQDRYSSAAEALRDVREYARPHWSHFLTKWREPKQASLLLTS